MTRKPIVVASVIGLIAVVAVWAIWHNHKNGRTLVVSGTVEATEAQLGFPVPGRLEQVTVDEGDTVAPGMVVAQLDRTETEARRQQAAAQVEAARALLMELEHGARIEEIAQARAARDAARERLRDAERDRDRTKILFDSGAVSREVYDKAMTQYDVAQSQGTQVDEQLRLIERGPREERIAAQRAQLAQTDAALHTIEATLQNMTIKAPFRGIVTVRHREPGEIVPAGSPVFTIMNPADRWVRVYVPEMRIGSVHVGQAASIASDTYAGKAYPGAVMTIASEAEFTPKTVQTAEERVKLVYATKVRIADDPQLELKPGMPVDVRLELGQ